MKKEITEEQKEELKNVLEGGIFIDTIEKVNDYLADSVDTELDDRTRFFLVYEDSYAAERSRIHGFVDMMFIGVEGEEVTPRYIELDDMFPSSYSDGYLFHCLIEHIEVHNLDICNLIGFLKDHEYGYLKYLEDNTKEV